PWAGPSPGAGASHALWNGRLQAPADADRDLPLPPDWTAGGGSGHRSTGPGPARLDRTGVGGSRGGGSVEAGALSVRDAGGRASSPAALFPPNSHGGAPGRSGHVVVLRPRVWAARQPDPLRELWAAR